MTAISATRATTRSSLGGQSQWDLIWREFRRRRLAVIAAVVILFLVTISVFAPFLANAVPIYYFGINRFEYQEAARNLRASVNQLIEVQKNDQANASVARLKAAISLQIRIMANELPADRKPVLKNLGRDLVAAADVADPAKRAEQLQNLRNQTLSDFAAGKVTFTSRSHWPVFASLNSLEVGFMVANLLLFLLPISRRLVGFCFASSHDSYRRWILCGIHLGLPLIVGCAWWVIVPARVDRTKYKEEGVFAADEAAAKAPVVYETVVWPPIAYSLDEVDLAGHSAAPIWYPAKWCPPGKDAASMKSTSQWSGPHWLGTDEAGRDVLCRMIWGGRVSLSVGLVAVAIYVFIGIVIGSVAGYFRGWCDLIISRIIEVMICFPTFFLILTIVAFFGQSITHIMLIIGLTGWTGIARLVRGEFLRLVDQEFVLAGRALGYSPSRIIFRHVLPNAMAPVLVAATFGIAGAILTESALSFLGLGISKPTPSWGGLLADGREAFLHAPWLIHFPGLAIFLTITAYNLIGEALRDASDPRLRGSR